MELIRVIWVILLTTIITTIMKTNKEKLSGRKRKELTVVECSND